MLLIQTPVAKHQIKTISNSTMTHTDLQDRSLGNEHTRSQLAQNRLKIVRKIYGPL